jgi:CheY-like chemotaxis protein
VFGISAAAIPAALQPEEDLRGLRILVVDDSANSREIFQDLLTGLGYAPVLTVSGEAGLSELQRAGSNEPYDLVFLDWKMPGMDGFETARAIRLARGLHRQPKIVMVTAYGDEELTRRAVAERLDGCIGKPVTASTLLDAIMTACGAAALSSHAANAVVAEQVPASLRGKRILLVEDNEFNRLVATELLSAVAAAIVTPAGNGQEAIDCLRAERFDAVLMDVQMPVMDGCQATELIRRDAAFASLPIIAMTAHAMASDRARCLAAGMNDYVTKPFEPYALFDVLAKWVDVAGAQRGLVDPKAYSDVPVNAQGLSFELGLQRCMGRADLYDRVLERYLAANMDDPGIIRSALDAQDLGRAARLAHSLISSAATIGADALSNAARDLHTAIRAGEADRWAGMLDFMHRQHVIVLASLQKHFADKSAHDQAGRIDAKGGETA